MMITLSTNSHRKSSHIGCHLQPLEMRTLQRSAHVEDADGFDSHGCTNYNRNLMSNNSSNNKRIAKNTAVLYVRMLFLMGISLFTTRVVLQALGVEDYGIYNVVGGIVALFAILSQALSSASSRFLNFEMGRGNFARLKAVFSTSVTIQIVLSIIIALLAEIGGIWFLNNKMVIPEERLVAANWVFQFSVLTFCVNLISVPYNAAIIAHEKMSAFAYISIYEGVAKLIVCYLVMVSPMDKLITYAALIFAIQLSVRFIYTWYCNRNFEECTYRFSNDKLLMKELFSYAGWNFIGSAAAVLRTQGGNIIINLFAGPAVNAARGVANQVNHAVSGFSNNFMTAVKPQITKSYAAGDIAYMTTLVNQSARFSFYLLLFLSLPIMVNIDFILGIWLKTVPDRTSIFVVLTMIFTMIESLSQPLMTAQLATGKVKNYQLIVGGINLLNLPVSYVLMKLGFVPEIFLYVAIFFSVVCLAARLSILKLDTGFESFRFVRQVLGNCTLVSIVALLLPLIVKQYANNSLISFVLIALLCAITTLLAEFYVGCSKTERSMAINKLKEFIKKKTKR